MQAVDGRFSPSVGLPAYNLPMPSKLPVSKRKRRPECAPNKTTKVLPNGVIKVGNRFVLTDAQIKEVGTLAPYLSIEQIAKYFGFSDLVFHAIMKRQPDVRKVYDSARQKTIRDISKSLIMKARAGNMSAIIFFLKCQAHWRETDKVDTKTIAAAASAAAAALVIRDETADAASRNISSSRRARPADPSSDED